MGKYGTPKAPKHLNAVQVLILLPCIPAYVQLYGGSVSAKSDSTTSMYKTRRKKKVSTCIMILVGCHTIIGEFTCTVYMPSLGGVVLNNMLKAHGELETVTHFLILNVSVISMSAFRQSIS